MNPEFKNSHESQQGGQETNNSVQLTQEQINQQQKEQQQNISNQKIEEICGIFEGEFSTESKQIITELINDFLKNNNYDLNSLEKVRQNLNNIIQDNGKVSEKKFIKLLKIELNNNGNQVNENIEKNEKREKIRKIVKNFNYLNHITDKADKNNNSYYQILQRINNVNNELLNLGESLYTDDSKIDWLNNEIKDITIILKNNPGILYDLATDLKGKGEYENFKNTLIELEPNLKNNFDALEAKWKTQIGTTSIDNAKRTSSGWEKSDGEYTTKVSNEGKRTFSIEGSKYEMDLGEVNQSRITEIDEITQKYDADIEPLNEKLSSLSSVIKFIKQAIEDNDELDEVKNYLKREVPDIYNDSELNLANAPSLDSMLNSLNFAFQKTKEDKERLEKETKDKIDRIVLQNAQDVQNKQEVQKQVLRFFRDIGFDAIPQNVINQVVDLLNANPSLKTKFGFHAGKIDFSSGSLGIETDADIFNINDKEKQLFIEFFNKMITGDSRYPLEYTGLTTQFYPTLEDFEAKTFSTTIDRNKYIGERLGSNQFLVIQKNLQKTEN